MKRINKLILGIVLLFTLSSSAFAKAYGYFWISTGGYLYYDTVDYGASEQDYILKATYNKGLPEINSIIRIEAKNRMYFDFNLIQDISREFTSLVKEEKCSKYKGSFSGFMTNYGSKECTVDRVIEKIKSNYLRETLYFQSKYPIKARVLGYVDFSVGIFVLVEQLEVIKEGRKDK